jgi:uncharacterized damage-inducible protein DinB
MAEAVWLSGPIAGVPPLLQPVAHSLLQSRRELPAVLAELTPAELRARPGGAASAEFHVRHAIGSLDRLTTYARGEQLGPAQLAELQAESVPDPHDDAGARLLTMFEQAVERALAQLRDTPESDLLNSREVGRARLPSNVIGLLLHAAEHTQRHLGQLTTTARIVKGWRGVGRSADAR